MKKSRFLVWTALVLSAFLISSCGGGGSSGGGVKEKVFLNAFIDFVCSPGWTNRDGALGRAPYSGGGTCEAPFPGPSGTYSVFLEAQTESDGSSPYAISQNGTAIAEGNYPYSTGNLVCNCPSKECPDVIMNLGAGIHEIKMGDVITFFGDDVYPCGDHGAYAKWQGIIFEPL